MTKFVPKVGEKYWWIAVNCFDNVIVGGMKREKYQPNRLTSFKNNCFQTKKEAQVAAKAIKKLLKNV